MSCLRLKPSVGNLGFEPVGMSSPRSGSVTKTPEGKASDACEK